LGENLLLGKKSKAQGKKRDAQKAKTGTAIHFRIRMHNELVDESYFTCK
jgi:hypothetical protein